MQTYGPVRLLRVRRPGVDRTLAILDRGTLDRYVSLVARAAGDIERCLSPNVLANRVAAWSVHPPMLRLRPWRSERRAFAARLLALAERRVPLAFVDVECCYASITPRVVERALLDVGSEGPADLERFLRVLERAGVTGLPVGPAPSAVLANAVLASVDRALERTGLRHIRWVDDIVLAADDPEAGLAVVSDALAPLGLRLNDGKTRLVHDPSREVLDARVSR